jgi:hypothetical protein
MNRARRPPLLHPLALVFERAVDSLGTALSPDTTRHYRGTTPWTHCGVSPTSSAGCPAYAPSRRRS